VASRWSQKTAFRHATTLIALRERFPGPEPHAGRTILRGPYLDPGNRQGRVASAWMLHEMASRGVIPLALCSIPVNPILVQGAALADLPMLAGFDEDITAANPDGVEVEVCPGTKELHMHKVFERKQWEPLLLNRLRSAYKEHLHAASFSSLQCSHWQL